MSAPIRYGELDSNSKEWDKNVIDFKGYNGSPNLKKSGVQVNFTREMMDEWVKCAHDPIYFAEKYIKIVHVDRGLIPIELYDYQKEVIETVKGNRKIGVTQSRQSGKCVHSKTNIKVRDSSSKKEMKISIGEFYKLVSTNIGITAIPPIDKKFVESHQISGWEVKTDTGWSPVSHIHKTIPYAIHVVKTSGNKELEAADDHILIDQDYNQLFVKDSFGKKIHTIDGIETIIEVTETPDFVNMYDITVNDNNHRFYTNGILSHNTTTATCIILHYILFNKHKMVALLANKGDAALEIMSRIQLAYEYLPKWIQSGVVEWNKGSIELENGCKIIASATSGSAIRGKACVSGKTGIYLLHKDETIAVHVSIEEASKIPDIHNYSIYDGNQYRKFDGFLIQEKELFLIECSNGSIEATEDHRFLDINNEWVEVKYIVNGTELLHAGKVINRCSIGVGTVYDPLNVDVTNQYQSNNFISHNCAFVYIDECVVGNTKVTVRDKVTGEIKTLNIEDLYK